MNMKMIRVTKFNKNKVLAFILTFSFILVNLSVSSFAMSIYPAQSSYEFEESQIGEKFVVDFMLSGNEGYNNSTFRIKYDPKVIKAVPNESSDSDSDNFITYRFSSLSTLKLFSDSSIETQLEVIPVKGADDFEGLSDGKKTSAEIGIIKLGQMVTNGYSVFEVDSDGIFLRMTFEVVGTGETDIQMLKAVGSKVLAYGLNSTARDVSVEPAHVRVNASASNQNNSSSNNSSNTSSERETQKETSTETTTSNNTNKETSTETTTSNNIDKETTTETATSRNNSSSSSSSSDDSNENTTDKTTESTTESISENTTEALNENQNTDNVSNKDTNKDNIESTADISKDSAFSDIWAFPWAQEAINFLAENKIVNGIGNEMFAPSANVKRADFLIMLMNSLGIEADSQETGFSDVPSSKYYAKAVGAAKTLGIANGDDNGNFKPEEFISRQDMMVLTYRALNAKKYELVSESGSLDKFDDKEAISEYAQEALNSMVSMKIVNGTGNNIEPKNNTTRAQSAVIIYNIYNYIN